MKKAIATLLATAFLIVTAGSVFAGQPQGSLHGGQPGGCMQNTHGGCIHH